MKKEDFDKLVHRLRTQNNRMTANPIFLVQEKTKVTVRTVSIHLTEATTDLWIAENRHNHAELSIYVDSLFRCHEFSALINALKAGEITLMNQEEIPTEEIREALSTGAAEAGRMDRGGFRPGPI